MIRILLVEDEALTAMYMKIAMETSKSKVDTIVATGEDAIESVKTTNPDVVLMDINLAGPMDGIEAAQEIGKISEVPIIFVTGYPDPNTRQKAEKLNPAGYFIKPINADHLLSALTSYGHS